MAAHREAGFDGIEMQTIARAEEAAEIRSSFGESFYTVTPGIRLKEDGGDDQKRVMLQTINYDADRVTRLLGDLLDVSRLEAGRLELKRQEVDVIALATDAVMRLRMDAGDHNLEVAFPDGFPKVTADPGRIEQVLMNLVENALKYAAPGRIVVGGTENHPIFRLVERDTVPMCAIWAHSGKIGLWVWRMRAPF